MKSLEERMKGSYESRAQTHLPRRTYTVLRLDGRAFHTYTARMVKPFDYALMDSLDDAACALCADAQGAQFAYLQSDECSVLLTDFEAPETEAWFDGNVQKIVSVAASVFTVAFDFGPSRTSGRASFDCRAFTVPDRIEVENYFVWRQKDCRRNSILAHAQAFYPAQDLDGADSARMREMVAAKDAEWEGLPEAVRLGRIVARKIFEREGARRTRWESEPAFDFLEERTRLTALIPVPWAKEAECAQADAASSG